MNDIKASERIVNHLFESFSLIYSPDRLKKSFESTDKLAKAKRMWASALYERGIIEFEQIRHAIRCCIHQSPRFIPSLGEFLSYCDDQTESAYGIDFERAYAEAVSNSNPSNKTRNWSHAVVYKAWIDTGPWNLMREKEKDSRKRFLKHYRFALGEFQSGRLHIRPPVAAITKNPPPLRATPEIAKQAIKDIKKILNG